MKCKSAILRQSGLFITALVLSMCMFSCQKDSKELKPVDEKTTFNEHFASEAEVTALATNISHTEPGARGKDPRTFSKRVESITSVPDENNETVFYIINYKNGGFVVMSADKRTNPVLAFSETKTFSTDKKEYPSGLVDWLYNTKSHVQEVRKNKVQVSEKTTALWTEACQMQRLIKPIDDCGGTGGGCQDQYETVGPLLSTTWGQGVGYNNYVPKTGCSNYSNGRAPSGCVATAMCQVMKYHQYPATYNWADMPNNYGTNTTSTLMKDAGASVGMNYSCDGSGAKMENVAPALKNTFKYTSASFGDYNYETVKSELRNKRPVILSGGRKSGWWIFASYKDGHAWVCDGFRRTFYCETGTSYLYMHMNWGWSGYEDGWYAFNNFNPADYTFNYDRKMIYNIRK